MNSCVGVDAAQEHIVKLIRREHLKRWNAEVPRERRSAARPTGAAQGQSAPVWLHICVKFLVHKMLTLTLCNISCASVCRFLRICVIFPAHLCDIS